jgi:hypothetical protein
LHLNNEEGGEWIEEEDCLALLDELLPLRQDLLRGDPRCLYLALIANKDHRQLDSYRQSLPIPPHLKALTPALRSFAEFFEISSELLDQIATKSDDSPSHSFYITQLFEQEKNGILQKGQQGKDLL